MTSNVRLTALEQRITHLEGDDSDLLSEYKKLQIQCSVVASDLENELESRRTWQQKAKKASEEYKHVCHLLGSKPITMILIDGNSHGYIFQAYLLQDGEVGDETAAWLLKKSIKSRIRKVDSAADDWSIVVYPFADFAALANTLIKHGVIESLTVLEVFVSGFNRFDPLFYFVNAGRGEACTGNKIRGTFNLYIDNPQYKHFLCGFTHGNAYAGMFNSRRDKDKQTTLLQAIPSAPAFCDSTFQKWKFSSIFRSQLFPDDAAQSLIANATSPAEASDTQNQSFEVIPTQASVSETTLVKKPILLNKSGQRLDPPLPWYLSSAKMTMMQREEKLGSVLS